MKVAICFAGQPRNISQKMYNNLYDKILSKYDCDIYAHFWYDEEKNTMGKASHWVEQKHLHVSNNLKDTFEKIYKPKKVVYEKPLEENVTDGNNYAYKGVTYILKSLYTSIKKVIDLIDDIHKYDYIIRLRTDLTIIDIPELLKTDKNIIHVRIIYGGNLSNVYRLPNTNMLDDNVFFEKFSNEGIGVSNNIVITNVKNKELFNIIQYYIEYYNNGTHMNDETIFYAHLKNMCNKYNFRIYNDIIKEEITRI